MDQTSLPTYGVKPHHPNYFDAPPPHHFKLRADLLDELCLIDHMLAILPATKAKYETWLRFSALSPNDCIWEQVRSSIDCETYRLPDRVLLRVAVVAGFQAPHYLVTDPDGLTTPIEPAGLTKFVFERAAHYCGHRGISQRTAAQHLRMQTLPAPNPGPKVVSAKWGIGYDRRVGAGTILDLQNAQATKLYLMGHDNINAAPALLR